MPTRIGDLLVESATLDPKDLEGALRLQRETGDPLGSLLVRLCFISERDVAAGLGQALGRLNTPQVKSLTVEDPVEYQIGRVNQIRIRPTIDLTFANALPVLTTVGEVERVTQAADDALV